MKKGTKTLSWLLVLALSMGLLLAGCGGGGSAEGKDGQNTSAVETTAAAVETEVQANQFPISKEPLNLKFSRLSWSGTFQNIGDMWKWKDYAAKTNINVTWDEIPISSYQETLKLKLSTGDLPDAYYQMIFTPEQLFENSQNGNLIALDELIDKYAPNIKKLFEENPEVKKSVSMPDGKVYSLPWVCKSILDASVRTYVNETIAKELGLAIPQTIDELTKYMQAMKEKYPDTYPITVTKGNTGILLDAFSGAWGLGNTGIQGMGASIDLGSDGKVRFYKTSDQYKAMLKQFRAWHDQKLIHPEAFTTLDDTRFQDLISKNQVGVYSWVSPFGDDNVKKNWKGVTQFKGPSGDQVLSWVDALVRGNWSFMITKNNKNPIETIKWVDYWYSVDAAIYSAIGTEGVTYQKNAEGKYEWIGEAKAAYDKNALYSVMGHYGGFEPGVFGMEYTAEQQKMVDDLTNPKGLTKAQQFCVDKEDDYKNYMPKEVWPSFIATDEEAQELAVIVPDMNTYLTEMRDKFITGAIDIDKEWDNYVANLKKIGADKYLQIKQAQYDRYKAN